MKDLFALSQEELDKRMTPEVENLVQKSFEIAGYIIYQDDRCVQKDEFIREYKDGKMELVRIGEAMEFEIIRTIH